MKKLILMLLLLNVGAAAAQMQLPLEPNRVETIKTTEGTFMNVDVSPGDNSIIFDLLGNIFLLKPGTTKAKQLTQGMHWDSDPRFSPDGEKIAFISDRSGSDKVWLMDKDGRNFKKVGPDTLRQRSHFLGWMPDGLNLFTVDSIYSVKDGTAREHTGLGGRAISFKEILPEFKKNEGRVFDIARNRTLKFENPGEVYWTRPLFSEDGKYAAYVSMREMFARELKYNTLLVKDLESGCHIYRKVVGEYLEYFPHFAFTPDSKKLIISYNGKLHEIDFLNSTDRIIPFEASIKVEMAPLTHFNATLPGDSIRLRFLQDGFIDERNNRIFFSALSEIWEYDLKNKSFSSFSSGDHGQFFPYYLKDQDALIYSSWDRNEEGFVWKISGEGGKPEKLVQKSRLYKYPVMTSDGRYLVFLTHERKYGRLKELRVPARLMVLDRTTGKEKILSENLKSINNIQLLESLNSVTFTGKFVPEKRSFPFIRQNYLNGRTDTLAYLPIRTTEAVMTTKEDYLAYILKESVHLVRLDKENTAPYELQKTAKNVSIKVGQPGAMNLDWNSKLEKFSWFTGGKMYTIDPYTLKGKDPLQKSIAVDEINIDLRVKTAKPSHSVFLKGARLITMEGNTVIENGGILVEGNRIKKIGSMDSLKIPSGIQVMDLKGKTILPGLIDMHAHFQPGLDIQLSQSHHYLLYLAYGMTTLRDPAITYHFRGYRELIESGKLTGPRIFGAVAFNPFNHHIASYKDALAWVRTEKNRGAKFLKVHDSWTREIRQHLVRAAREERINITGHPDWSHFSYFLNLAILQDGYGGMEHPINHGRLYKDVLSLIKAAGIWITPALLYETSGYRETEDEILPRKDLFEPSSEKRFLRSKEKDVLDPDGIAMYYLKNVSKLANMGVNISVGSHSEDPVLYYTELFAFGEGGMSPFEVLKSATIIPAKGMGMDEDLGSLKEGKLADLLILNSNPLDDLKELLDIDAVMKNGFLYKQEDLLRKAKKIKDLTEASVK